MTLAFGSIVEQNTLPPHSIIFKLRVTNTVTVRNFGFVSDGFNVDSLYAFKRNEVRILIELV
jgi:hypothetical protein